MNLPPWVVVGCALLASGCIRTHFVPTDPTHAAAPNGKTPTIYLDRLPDRPYHSVGIIEAVYPAGFSLNDILPEVQITAREVGCDLVVDRAIFPIGSAEASKRWWKRVAYAPIGHPVTQSYSPPPDRREFICGVFDLPAPPGPPPPSS